MYSMFVKAGLEFYSKTEPANPTFLKRLKLSRNMDTAAIMSTMKFKRKTFLRHGNCKSGIIKIEASFKLIRVKHTMDRID